MTLHQESQKIKCITFRDSQMAHLGVKYAFPGRGQKRHTL